MTDRSPTTVSEQELLQLWQATRPDDIPIGLGPYVNLAMVWLVGRYNEWRDANEDDAVEYASQAFEAVLPTGRSLWALLAEHPELGELPGPGAVAPTLEGVVLDTLTEALDEALDAWMDACHDAEHPSASGESEG